ncbi:MAG: hypothetical protein EBZ49_01210 [Proteobacteria bacterium]|nr:hypothetical protein [Pseudomonadota bacterium]
MAESKLLKLKTDLKSLKFDPNNEPYIQFPIGYTKSFEKNDSIPTTITDYYLSNRTNPDFPLRGGTINFDLRTQTFTLASQIDKERIKKFFQDAPRGPLFLKKQIGLQLSNPKIETDSIISGVILPRNAFPEVPVILENTRFYNNGINTLAQVGVQGTGVHTLRHGVLPFNPFTKAYYDTVNKQNVDNNYSKNRLVTLKLMKLSNTPNQTTRTTAANLGVSLSPNNLLQYLGGPDSVYGIGVTTIKRYDNTEQGTTRIKDKLASGQISQAYAKISKSYREIQNTEGSVDDAGNIKYSTSTREKLYGIGDPGNRAFMQAGEDRMNTNKLLYFNANEAPWEIQQNQVYTKDIIKFVFEAIDNDNTANATAVFFRAFLSGITDNHQASINSFRYVGRGEEFYTYQGVARSIGFSFKIAPQSAQEQRPLYKKLNYLISQVYPDYSSRTGIMRAPLMRITIGDYFYRLPGLLENVNITIDDNVPWEINDDSYFKQLPHVISVQCSFKPIQDFLPRREKVSRLSNAYTISDNEENVMNVPYITDSKRYFVSIEDVQDTQGDVTRNPKLPGLATLGISSSNAITPMQSIQSGILQSLSNRGPASLASVTRAPINSFYENNTPFGQ